MTEGKRKRFRKAMAVLTVAGIFLAGLGTGVGFVEYSGFSYQGNVILGEKAMAQTTLVWDLEEECFALSAYVHGSTDQIELAVEGDRSVPKDQVIFEVTYNEELGKPALYQGNYWEDDGKRWGDAEIYFRRTSGRESEVKLVMEAKDRILEEMKEHKFSTYEYYDICSVRARVNPANEDLLTLVS